MKPLFFSIVLLSLMGASRCAPIKYKDDISFMGSAVANSPEYLITLNGSVCKDTDGIIGFCAKRLSKSTDLVIEILPQQYAYTFKLDCTDAINSDIAFDVLSGVKLSHKIIKDKYQYSDVFNCTIDIFPHDRAEPIAAFAAFRIMLVDAEYSRLEVPFISGKNLVLGEHSLYSWIDGSNHNKTTVVEYKNQKKIVIESYNMRLATYGF